MDRPTMAQLIAAAYGANPEAMNEATERALRESDVSREINDALKHGNVMVPAVGGDQ